MVIHPLLLHFPIALLLIGDLALLLDLTRPGLLAAHPASRLGFEGFVNGVLGLGFAGLVLTIITGLFDMQAGPKTQARDGWIVIAVAHIISAVSLLIIYGFLLYRRFVILPPSPLSPTAPTEIPAPDASSVRRDWPSLLLAVMGLLVLILVGWLGGTLVYEYRIGVS